MKARNIATAPSTKPKARVTASWGTGLPLPWASDRSSVRA